MNIICNLTEGKLSYDLRNVGNLWSSDLKSLKTTTQRCKYTFFYHNQASFISIFTAGYSGSDMKNLVKDATMGPLREALKRGIDITNLTKDDMGLVTLQVNTK